MLTKLYRRLNWQVRYELELLARLAAGLTAIGLGLYVGGGLIVLLLTALLGAAIHGVK